MKEIFISIISFIFFSLSMYFVFSGDLFFAIGFTVLLLIHELGHIFALIKINIPIKGMYFIPFFGAGVSGNLESIKYENEYAYLKFFGPYAGMFSSIIAVCLFFIFNDSRFLELAFYGAILNITNLIPITFLDGYGILRGSIKHVEWIGFFMMIAIVFFWIQSYVFGFFLLILFTLFADSQFKESSGFQIHEVIFTIIFFTAIIFFTIKDTEMLMVNIPIIVFSVYAFFIYIKSTCFDDENNDKQEEEKLILLTKTEKIFWIIKYAILIIVYFAVIYYHYIYFKN